MTTLRELPTFSSAHKSFRTYKECAPATLQKYKGKIPPIITESWSKHGFEEISNGFLWTVDPEEYRSIIADFVYPDQLDNVHVLIRTGLGSMIFQYKDDFVHLSAVSMRHSKLDGSLEATLELELGHRRFLNGIFYMDFFKKAHKKLGRLTEDEVYGFVPSPMLGGELNPANLEKLKLVAYLNYLSQLQPNPREGQL